MEVWNVYNLHGIIMQWKHHDHDIIEIRNSSQCQYLSEHNLWKTETTVLHTRISHLCYYSVHQTDDLMDNLWKHLSILQLDNLISDYCITGI